MERTVCEYGRSMEPAGGEQSTRTEREGSEYSSKMNGQVVSTA